jgi:hypothetical protein
MTNQNAHLHSASPQSFTSACIPFSTFLFIGIGLSSMVHSLAVKAQESSTPKISRHDFTFLAFEPVTSTNQSKLQQDLLDLSLLNTFSIAKLDSFSIKAFKFVDASHYSKTFLHFSKGFAIFCEGDQDSANNGKDDEVIILQKSNLPSLLSLALAISTQTALDALVQYNTLAATSHNMAFGPAFDHSKLIEL